MAYHKLKVWKEFVTDLKSGLKTFEVRKNDRDFQVGDKLRLMEYDQDTGEFGGWTYLFEVTYILHGGKFGIEEGYVVMGIKPVEP